MIDFYSINNLNKNIFDKNNTFILNLSKKLMFIEKVLTIIFPH